MHKIHLIDSHTGGEPTRVIVAGGPDLGRGPLAARRERFRLEHDRFRSAVVNEPRGSDVLVGALLVEPEDPACAAGVIFFNNVGYLGMCGHGTIGLVVTLAHLGRLQPGEHQMETPVGVIKPRCMPTAQCRWRMFRAGAPSSAVTVAVPGIGPVTGMWPGAAIGFSWWKIMARTSRLTNVEELTDYRWRVRQAVNAQGFPRWITWNSSAAGPERRASEQLRAMSRQGLRPLSLRHRHQRQAGLSGGGRQIVARRALGAGKPSRQLVFWERFWLDRTAGKMAPVITGTAFVNAEPTHLLDERDPFCWGLRG